LRVEQFNWNQLEWVVYQIGLLLFALRGLILI